MQSGTQCVLNAAISDMQTTDQYHLGFTMRFPRAMSIREDLSRADCVTASGAVLHSFVLSSFLLVRI
jgi:DNA ligase 4